MRRDVAHLLLSLAVLVASILGCGTTQPRYQGQTAALQERFEKVWYACRHHIVPRVCKDHIGTSYLDCSSRNHVVCMYVYGYERVGHREWVLTQDGRHQVEIEQLVEDATR